MITTVTEHAEVCTLLEWNPTASTGLARQAGFHSDFAVDRGPPVSPSNRVLARGRTRRLSQQERVEKQWGRGTRVCHTSSLRGGHQNHLAWRAADPSVPAGHIARP